MILITGASGLLGSHLVEQSLARQQPILCVYRSERKRSYLEQVHHPLVKKIKLDLVNNSLPQNLAKEIHTVINAMGSTASNSESTFELDNLKATQNLYQTLSAHSVQHWIQVSSIATFNPNVEEITESTPVFPRNTAYAKSKADTDAWLAKQTLIPNLTTVYPTYLLGSWDSRPSSGGILIALKLKKIKTFIEGTKNFASAREVAKSILKIADQKQSGAFILGGTNRLISEFLKISSEILKLNADAFEMSHSKDMQNEPKIIQEFCATTRVNDGLARQTLHHDPDSTDLYALIEETYESFKKMRMIF